MPTIDLWIIHICLIYRFYFMSWSIFHSYFVLISRYWEVRKLVIRLIGAWVGIIDISIGIAWNVCFKCSFKCSAFLELVVSVALSRCLGWCLGRYLDPCALSGKLGVGNSLI